MHAYADFDGSGTLQTRYLHGPAVDMLLARTSAAGTTAWYLTDRLGSLRDLASTSGTVINHVAYDGFGRVVSESSPANGDRFKFTGRRRRRAAEGDRRGTRRRGSSRRQADGGDAGGHVHSEWARAWWARWRMSSLRLRDWDSARRASWRWRSGPRRTWKLPE